MPDNKNQQLRWVEYNFFVLLIVTFGSDTTRKNDE